MSTILELTQGHQIESFVISAKNVKTPTALVGIVSQVLSAPNVFVFGELLAMENIKQLKNSAEKAYYELLEIFAYGTFADYKARENELPTLTKPQTRKLKQLSITTLAAKNRVIPYDLLLKNLDIPNVRELEDLVIDCIYQGLLEGKLDQQRSQLEVDMSIGRDIKPEEFSKIQATLEAWYQQSGGLLDTIKQKIDWAKESQDRQKTHKADFEKKIESIKANLKAIIEQDIMMDSSGHFEGAEYYDHRPHNKGRKGLKSKVKGNAPKDRRGRNM